MIIHFVLQGAKMKDCQNNYRDVFESRIGSDRKLAEIRILVHELGRVKKLITRSCFFFFLII